jgi:alpha-1,3-rhamnosyl/mannosyltransferase
LHAYARLSPNLRSRFPLLLAGGWGWRSERIREMLTQTPWSECVRWMGYVADEDLVALVNAASLLAYPSLYEGFGLPPLEAMACGTPVVSSHAGGLREAVGDAALVVQPRDTVAMTNAVAEVLEHPARAAELRQAGFARAAQFSWDRTADRTADAYRRAA